MADQVAITGKINIDELSKFACEKFGEEVSQEEAARFACDLRNPQQERQMASFIVKNHDLLAGLDFSVFRPGQTLDKNDFVELKNLKTDGSYLKTAAKAGSHQVELLCALSLASVAQLAIDAKQVRIINVFERRDENLRAKELSLSKSYAEEGIHGPGIDRSVSYFKHEFDARNAKETGLIREGYVNFRLALQNWFNKTQGPSFLESASQIRARFPLQRFAANMGLLAGLGFSMEAVQDTAMQERKLKSMLDKLK